MKLFLEILDLWWKIALIAGLIAVAFFHRFKSEFPPDTYEESFDLDVTEDFYTKT